MTTMTAWWLLRFLVYDKKKQSLTLSRVSGFSNNFNRLATILSRVSRVESNLKMNLPNGGKASNNLLKSFKIFTYPKPLHSHRVRQQNCHQG